MWSTRASVRSVHAIGMALDWNANLVDKRLIKQGRTFDRRERLERLNRLERLERSDHVGSRERRVPSS